MSECLLFVAAGQAQAPIISAASGRAYRVAAMDQDPAAAGFEFAHEHYVGDIIDADNIIRIAQTCGASGIVCISCDAALPAVVKACEVLGLPSISPATVAMSTSKVLQRKALVDANLPTPWHVVVTNLQQIADIEKSRPPSRVVVKPADSSGSRGVSLVEVNEPLIDAITRAMAFSHQQAVLVEAFIEGNEYSVEAWVSRGQISILGCSEKIRTQPPYLLDREVHFPPAIDEQLIRSLKSQATLAIQACGYDNCPVHVECILSEDRPVIVELAARGAGFRVFSEMLQQVSGVDITQACIDTALGKDPVLEPTLAVVASSLIFIDPVPGVFTHALGVEHAENIEGISDISIYPARGDTLQELRSGADRAGHVIAYAGSSEVCRHAARKAASEIQLLTQHSTNAVA